MWEKRWYVRSMSGVFYMAVQAAARARVGNDRARAVSVSTTITTTHYHT